MDRIRFELNRFWNEQTASVTIESVFMFPLLMWAYFGMFILFDGYRAASANVRTGYTISDLLSREDQAIVDQDYIEGLNSLQDILTQSPHRTVLRVTAVRYYNDEYSIYNDCSFATGGKTALENGDLLTKIVPYLPTMSDSEVLIVVETWMAFVPFMNLSIRPISGGTDDPEYNVFPAFYFENLVATPHRFTELSCT